MTALLFALAIYVLALGTIGIVSNRKSKKTSADFFVASRGLGSFVMLMTMFATTMSAFSLLGVPQSGYLDGMGMLAGIGFGDAFIGFWIFLFGYRIWKAGRANGFITPTEFYRHRFNSDFVGICYMVNAFIFVFPFIGIQTIGGGNALAVATNGLITKEMAMIITVAVIIVYTILGGIKASAWADTMQSCIMVVSCLVVFVLSATYFKDGGFASATNQVIAAGNESLLTLPGPKGLWNWKYMVSYALMGGMSAPLWPQVFSRYYMNKNSASMKKMALLWPLMCLVLFLPMVLVGVWGTVIMPGVSNPDQILPLIVTKLFPPFVGAFIIVGIFAALMSTAASQLVALSTMVSRDIYLKYIDKNADDRKQILVGRISIIVIGCATLILGLKPPAIISTMASWVFTGNMTLVPMTLAALYWKGTTKAGAIASSIVTFVLNVGFLSGLIPKTLAFGFMTWVPSLLVGTIVLIVVSKLTKPLDSTLVDTYFNRIWKDEKNRLALRK